MWSLSPHQLFSARSTKGSRATPVKQLCPAEDTISGPDSTPSKSRGLWGAVVTKDGRLKTHKFIPAVPALFQRPASTNSRTDLPAEQEDKELTAFIQRLLTGVFEQSLQESHAQEALSTCPELAWLAECSRRMPLPPGWSKVPSKAEPGKIVYQCDATKGVSDTPPCFQHFVRLGRLAANTRTRPEEATASVAGIRGLMNEVNTELDDLERSWSGPHLDPATQMEYYHCEAAGISTWEHPGRGALYLASIAERLLDASPFASAIRAENAARASTKSSRSDHIRHGIEKALGFLESTESSDHDDDAKLVSREASERQRNKEGEMLGADKAEGPEYFDIHSEAPCDEDIYRTTATNEGSIDFSDDECWAALDNDSWQMPPQVEAGGNTARGLGRSTSLSSPSKAACGDSQTSRRYISRGGA